MMPKDMRPDKLHNMKCLYYENHFDEGVRDGFYDDPKKPKNKQPEKSEAEIKAQKEEEGKKITEAVE